MLYQKQFDRCSRPIDYPYPARGGEEPALFDAALDSALRQASN